ncbi:MAG: flagellar biosynthetic protein FliO [Firmicutes bacterium]|nr:flagellar biosynthetic protein FliO [[Eubacterium] siraeum]MCM1486938.1 flagellar biosynthetic protein FliO [Bacillota bacterium]
MDWLQWALSFLGVLGLIFFLFYAIKKLNKGISVKSGAKLRVLDRINLGRDGMLLVVSVCNKLMLLGVTSQRVDKLCDLDMTDEEYLNAVAPQSGETSADFKSVLLSMMGKKTQESEGERSDDNASEKSDTTE